MNQAITNALKQVWCSDLTPIHNAGVHFEWDIQWILNPRLVFISALMHKRQFRCSSGHDDECPARPSDDHQLSLSRHPRQNSLIMLSLDLPTPTHFTGTCRKSSINRMYACACEGSSSKLRTPSVLQLQPGNVS